MDSPQYCYSVRTLCAHATDNNVKLLENTDENVRFTMWEGASWWE
jgi:hypothetical protein